MTKPAAPSETGNCRPASTAEGSFKEFAGCEGIRRQGWFPFRRGRDVVAIHAWASESAEKVDHSELALKHCLVREELPNEVVRDAGKTRWYHGIGRLSGCISLSALPLFRAWDTACDRLSRTNQYNLAACPTSASARLTFLATGRMLSARSGLLDVYLALFRISRGTESFGECSTARWGGGGG